MITNLMRFYTNPQQLVLKLVNLLVCLFFALALVIKSGYSYPAVLLLFLALITLPGWWRKVSFNRYHYYLISALALMAMVGALNAWRIDSTGTEYNFPVRYLVSILLLLFLSVYPPDKKAILWGVALAGIGAGITAYYYTYYAPELLSGGRAARYLNPIQFGNIAVMMAMLALIGLVYLFTKKRDYLLQLVLFAGVVGGIIASLLAQARGGWVAFCLTLVVLLLSSLRQFSFHRFTVKQWGLLFGGMVMITVFSVGYFGDVVKSRLEYTKNEWQAYEQGYNQTSMGARLDMWQFAWYEGWRYPILGPNSRQMVIDKEIWVEAGHGSSAILKYGHLHNEYLDAFATKGLLGVIALGWLFFSPIIIFTRARRHEPVRLLEVGYMGLAVVLMYMGFGLTQVSLTHHSSGFMLYVFPLCIMASCFLSSVESSKEFK